MNRDDSGYFGVLRSYIDPSDDVARRAAELAEFCADSRLSGVMLFTAAHERQPWVLDARETESMVKAVSRAAGIIRAQGLVLDINVVTTLGHDDGGVPESGAPVTFRSMVDIDGTESVGIVCPIDPAFHKYYAWFIREIAAVVRPRVIWIDDDLRYTWHPSTVYVGCFCDRHCAEFARALGMTSARREDVVAQLFLGDTIESRKSGLATYAKVLSDEMQTFARRVRSAVDSVAPEVRVGYMGNAPDVDHAAGIEYRTFCADLAGATRPVLRPHLRVLRDGERRALPLGTDTTLLSQVLAAPSTEIVTEVDGNWPHSLYHRSAATLINAVSATSFFGITAHSYFLYGFGTVPFAEIPEYRAALRAIAPFSKAISQTVAELPAPEGIQVPFIPEARLPNRRTATDSLGLSLLAADRSWVATLSILGLPLTYTDAGPLVLPSDHAEAIDTGRLSEYLSRGVFMDGRAAEILVERGLGDLIGVEAMSPLSGPVTAERIDDHEMSQCGRKILVGPGVTPRDHFFRITPNHSTLILSTLMEFWTKPVGPGLIAYENPQGGRAVVSAYGRSGSAMPAAYENPLRKAQLSRVFSWLARKPLPAEVIDRPCIWILTRGLQRKRLVLLTNLSFDPVESVTIAIGDLAEGQYSVGRVAVTSVRQTMVSTFSHGGGKASISISGRIEPQEATLYVVESE